MIIRGGKEFFLTILPVERRRRQGSITNTLKFRDRLHKDPSSLIIFVKKYKIAASRDIGLSISLN